MSAEMPARPLLLRTSTPNDLERITRRLALTAREVPAKQLAAALEISEGTVARRRRGRGWKTAEVLRLATLLGVDPSTLFRADRRSS